MADKLLNVQPIALGTTTTTNLLNPPAASSGVNAGSSGQYITLRHIHVANRTVNPASFALWKGASNGNTAGTEFVFAGQASAGALTVGTGVVVPANGYVDVYGYWRLDTGDFIVGGASTTNALTILFGAYISVSG